jgi:murein DD-endopeptidase MepM/ murein hydrolase activator NlpD
MLLSAGGAAYAVASFAPDVPKQPVRLVTEAVPSSAWAARSKALELPSFTLYRSETTRAADTPEGLLERLNIADPAAAKFLRGNALAREALFKRRGRTVNAEASEQQTLLSLRTQWVEKDDEGNFKRLIVEKSGDDFTARVETAPLVVSQRLVSGTIYSTLFAATDEAGMPDSVTRQLTEIFDSEIDFHRSLHKGDTFAIVYETLEADGEAVQSGRVLSAEFVNRGRVHQALWFADPKDAGKGSYYSFDGQSLRKAYLISPLQVSRVTSGFGSRIHPVLGYRRDHTGIDYAAPVGTPVRSIGDGQVTFAGVQGGYGNVIYIKHRNNQHSTVYAHLSKINVKKGATVAQGETIALSGQSGRVTGPHLHLEFRVNNNPIDPTEMLANQREDVAVAASSKVAFAKLAESMKVQLDAARASNGVHFE